MSRLICLLWLCSAGCYAGLVPPPAARDPAAADAPVPEYQPPKNPLEGSAFEPENSNEPQPMEGHEGHHHGHHKHHEHAEHQKQD